MDIEKLTLNEEKDNLENILIDLQNLIEAKNYINNLENYKLIRECLNESLDNLKAEISLKESENNEVSPYDIIELKTFINELQLNIQRDEINLRGLREKIP